MWTVARLPLCCKAATLLASQQHAAQGSASSLLLIAPLLDCLRTLAHLKRHCLLLLLLLLQAPTPLRLCRLSYQAHQLTSQSSAGQCRFQAQIPSLQWLQHLQAAAPLHSQGAAHNQHHRA
jgi:hypothetical protein